ncbi:LuxR C-terminal-related transcriptional regulator [Rhizobium sp. FY34]|uniref:helix-turn-helix transcriptional regulator n=1 Tax=Rhizobium sp. FY34 TaxID=2562309 RepID=UPI0010BF6B8C|nr:LuxR C-terminal-related transcriptional regulator [Rhizobium sp. FY34]
MITLDRHCQLSREISEADTRASIVAAMKKLPAQFGFRYYALMRAPAAADTCIEPLMVETNLTRSYIREFDSKKLLAVCPVAPLLANMALPLCWTCTENIEECWPLQFTDELRHVLTSHGVSTGVAMPLVSSDSSTYLMRLDGERPLLTLPELNELGMLFVQAFRTFDRLRATEVLERNFLTAREMEVLRWTSQGKTSSEIANILSLSDHTVNAYLNKAIKKLDCVNRTQLVAKAIRLRLIS